MLIFLRVYTNLGVQLIVSYSAHGFQTVKAKQHLV